MRYLYVFINLVLPFIGCTQIVNIESLRKTEVDTIPLHYRIEASTALSKNTRSIFWINLGSDIQFHRGQHTWLSVTDLNFNRSGGETLLNEGFQHLRYNRDLSEAVGLEAFVQGQYNEAIKLRMRGLLGMGIRIDLVEDEKLQIKYGISYMYEYDEESEAGFIHRDHRMNNYLSMGLNLSNQATLSSTTYFQPVAFRFNDFRLSSQTALTLKISDRLRFQAAFALQYDSRNPSGVPPSIYRLTSGLVWAR